MMSQRVGHDLSTNSSSLLLVCSDTRLLKAGSILACGGHSRREPTCQCGGQRFSSHPGKTPHTAGPRAHTPQPPSLRSRALELKPPSLRPLKPVCPEPVPTTREAPAVRKPRTAGKRGPLTETRESLCAAVKIRHSQK